MATKYYEELCSDSVKSVYPYDEVIVSKRTAVQQVDLLKGSEYGKMLFLDGEGQSSSLDEGMYHEMLVHPILTSVSGAKSVLIIGGGEGATLREVVKYKNLEKIVMVDYDAELIEIFKEHCPEYSNGAYEDPRVELRTMSIWDYLNNDVKFDVVICDLNDGFEGIENLFLRLSEVATFMTVQMGQLSPLRKEELKLQKDILDKLFKYKFYPYKVFIPFFQSEWLFYSNFVGFGRFDVETKHITPNFFRANMDMPPWWESRDSAKASPHDSPLTPLN
jgi:spermidine synthase